MPPVLKVNGLDLSTFLRVQPDDGLDPVDVEFEQPQFGGAPALNEGGIFVADSARNKQWTAPLWTHSASGAQGVNALVEQINNQLQRGPAAVEFKPEGASQSTFFDLEAGRLDPQYSHFHHRKGWTKSTLHLWTKPYGHTATMRSVVPSQVWPGASGPVNVLATGLQGDTQALANIYATPSQAGLFMFGVSPLPSFNPFIHATRFVSGDTSTVVAAPSTLGGVVRAYASFPNATSNQINFHLGPNDYCGRNRVFLLAGHKFSGSSVASSTVQMMLHDSTYDALNPQPLTLATQCIATFTAGAVTMQLIDLGEVTVPSQVTGAGPAPTTTLSITAHVTFPTYFATYALQLNGVVIVPLDHSAGIVASHAVGGGNNLAVRSWPAREGWSSAFVATGFSGFGPSGLPHSDLMRVLRGDVLRMPKGATQARIMAFAYKGGGLIANPVYGMTIQVDALERFKFLR